MKERHALNQGTDSPEFIFVAVRWRGRYKKKYTPVYAAGDALLLHNGPHLSTWTYMNLFIKCSQEHLEI